MSDDTPRRRGPASRKFYRRSTTGAAHAQRVQFGVTWGAYNAHAARQLRQKGRA